MIWADSYGINSLQFAHLYSNPKINDPRTIEEAPGIISIRFSIILIQKPSQTRRTHMLKIRKIAKAALKTAMRWPLNYSITAMFPMPLEEEFPVFLKELEEILQPVRNNAEFQIGEREITLGGNFLVYNVYVAAKRTPANEKIMAAVKAKAMEKNWLLERDKEKFFDDLKLSKGLRRIVINNALGFTSDNSKLVQAHFAKALPALKKLWADLREKLPEDWIYQFDIDSKDDQFKFGLILLVPPADTKHPLVKEARARIEGIADELDMSVFS